MKKAIVRKWVKALRSGKYKQNKDGYLSKVGADGGTSYCCLGVLRDVIGGKYYSHEATAHLKPSHACGLTRDEMDELAARNDGVRHNGFAYKAHSFKQIAALLERRYLK